jgi:malate synthase
MRDDLKVAASDLLDIASANGKITEKGVRTNINVALLYIESWLRGIGAAALHNLMEDAATAEISRAQLWQCIQHSVALEDGRIMTPSLYQKFCEEEYNAIRKEFTASGNETLSLATSRLILDRLVLSKNFDAFLTTKAYLHIQ